MKHIPKTTKDGHSYLVDDDIADSNALRVQGREQSLGLRNSQLRRDGHYAELRSILVSEQVAEFHLQFSPRDEPVLTHSTTPQWNR